MKGLEKLLDRYGVTLDDAISDHYLYSKSKAQTINDLPPNRIEAEYLRLALKGLRGDRRVLLQEVITVAAEAD